MIFLTGIRLLPKVVKLNVQEAASTVSIYSNKQTAVLLAVFKCTAGLSQVHCHAGSLFELQPSSCVSAGEM